MRAFVIASVACSLCLWGELLPIRSYTIADGLPADQIDGIVPDSRGFVWFLTPEGLSRFDGHRITNFGIDQGLPSRAALSFLETRSGEYWVGTPRGLSQLRAGTGKNQFVTYRPGTKQSENFISALLQSSTGKIWVGTYDGLFEMLENHQFRRHKLPPPQPGWNGVEIGDIVEDRCGKLWMATTSGIYVLARDGTAQTFRKKSGLPSEIVNTLLAGNDGRLWAGMRGGLVLMRDGCPAGAPGVERIYPPELGRDVVSLAEGQDGALWVGTENGIVRLLRNGVTEHLTKSQGLTDRFMYSLASDQNGNIWAGTEGAGAMKIQPSGFKTFGEPDGLGSSRVWSVFGDLDGTVLAVTGSADQTSWLLNIFNGSSFRARAAPQGFAKNRTWGNHRILLQSRTGVWWAATSKGLCRYSAGKPETLPNRAPDSCYFPDRLIFQIFEDSKGGIWAASQSEPQWDRLMRWDPNTNAIATFDNFPNKDALVKSFAEDRQGNIWLGTLNPGGLYRYNGREFTRFTTKEGIPAGTIAGLVIDAQGRLWIGAEGGIGLIENPSATGPLKVRIYRQADGLSSNNVRALVDDKDGFIYAGTTAGVDRLDPRTGQMKHFSAADGLVRGQMQSAFRDRAGDLWFATALGLSRLSPAAPNRLSGPAILITRLQAGGQPSSVSPRGETSISRIELDPARNQLQVEFVAVSGEAEANLRYAYKLEGSDPDWSTFRRDHLVNYAALAAGSYRFLVKAMNSDGVESATPAEVRFTVLPPFWRRWWFEVLALLAVASIVYLLHRYRVAQIVGLERMRTTIATDLHDDIGAGLSQIAILSEVARAGVSRDDRLPQEALQRVGVLSRELVDSMSDIVWSIRADPDGFHSLVRRIRESALDLLVSQGIDFELRTPQPDDEIQISLHARRQLFLMFKECIHNVARHSECTVVKADLKIQDRAIELTVADNGKGLNKEEKPAGSAGGNGIPGMRRRIETLGGSIDFRSSPGEGCTVTIRFPLR